MKKEIIEITEIIGNSPSGIPPLRVEITDYGEEAGAQIWIYWAESTTLIYKCMYDPREGGGYSSDEEWTKRADTLIRVLGIQGERTYLEIVRHTPTGRPDQLERNEKMQTQQSLMDKADELRHQVMMLQDVDCRQELADALELISKLSVHCDDLERRLKEIEKKHRHNQMNHAFGIA